MCPNPQTPNPDGPNTRRRARAERHRAAQLLAEAERAAAAAAQVVQNEEDRRQIMQPALLEQPLLLLRLVYFFAFTCLIAIEVGYIIHFLDEKAIRDYNTPTSPPWYWPYVDDLVRPAPLNITLIGALVYVNWAILLWVFDTFPRLNSPRFRLIFQLKSLRLRLSIYLVSFVTVLLIIIPNCLPPSPELNPLLHAERVNCAYKKKVGLIVL